MCAISCPYKVYALYPSPAFNVGQGQFGAGGARKSRVYMKIGNYSHAVKKLLSADSLSGRQSGNRANSSINWELNHH